MRRFLQSSNRQSPPTAYLPPFRATSEYYLSSEPYPVIPRRPQPSRCHGGQSPQSCVINHSRSTAVTERPKALNVWPTVTSPLLFAPGQRPSSLWSKPEGSRPNEAKSPPFRWSSKHSYGGASQVRLLLTVCRSILLARPRLQATSQYLFRGIFTAEDTQGTSHRVRLPFDETSSSDRHTAVYLTTAFHSQGFAPSQWLNLTRTLRLYFTPLPPIGFQPSELFPRSTAAAPLGVPCSLTVGKSVQATKNSLCTQPSFRALTLPTRPSLETGLFTQSRAAALLVFSLFEVSLFFRWVSPPPMRLLCASGSHPKEPATIRRRWTLLEVFNLMPLYVYSDCEQSVKTPDHIHSKNEYLRPVK